jgi:hypothetical protein
MINLKFLLIFSLLFFCFVGKDFGQSLKNNSDYLKLRVSLVSPGICIGENLKIRITLINQSDKPIVIDTKSILYRLSFSSVRLISGRVTSSNKTEIGDKSPESTGNYIILKPNKSYRIKTFLSLNDDFFQKDSEYNMRIAYGQFSTTFFESMPVWKGVVESDVVVFTLKPCS